VLQGYGFYFPSGRPLRVNGTPVVASFHEGVSRELDSHCVGLLSPDVAARMGARWLADATLEYSAIHAFVALARNLAAHGAPASLVRRALGAAAEEQRHTSACVEMAARYTGRTWCPPVEPMASLRVRGASIVDLVRETWIDGCIGEGLAAEMAGGRASECSPHRGRAVLSTIAADERRHAELGFDVLRFLLTMRGDHGEIARREFAHLLRHTHSPAYVRDEGDEWRDAAEGRSNARLGATVDRTAARGAALLSKARTA
jgi:hypothetical protein